MHVIRRSAPILLILCAVAAQAAVTFEWTADDTGAVEPMETLVSFRTTLTNTGGAADVYTLTMSGTLPAGWSNTFCVGTTCYPPWVLSVDVALAPGAGETVLIDLSAFTTPGAGTIAVTAVSQAHPTDVESLDFTLATPGPEILLVAADDGGGHDVWYRDSLDRLGRTYAVWPRQSAGALARDELDRFAAVIWETGFAAGGLQACDRGVLGGWVENGGRLFISGQDLAREAGDPTHPFYDPAAASWLADVPGVEFLGEGVMSIQRYVSGVVGCPITATWPGDNPYLGDGAVVYETYSADVIRAVGPGRPACEYIDYSPAGGAAVYAQPGRGRSFFCGFAWEGLRTAAGRDGLLARVLAWWDGDLTAVAAEPTPTPAPAPRAAPNPFNPSTEIRFTLAAPADCAVVVHNLRGRALRTLLNGRADAGERVVRWDGRDDAGRVLPGGIYLARVRIGDAETSLKLTLAK
jgi:hypothetical protein